MALNAPHIVWRTRLRAIWDALSKYSLDVPIIIITGKESFRSVGGEIVKSTLSMERFVQGSCRHRHRHIKPFFNWMNIPKISSASVVTQDSLFLLPFRHSFLEESEESKFSMNALQIVWYPSLFRSTITITIVFFRRIHTPGSQS